MSKMMLAVVKEKPTPGIIIKKIPIPKPKKDEILVKVLFASICGTDIGIYDWTPWAASHIKPPIVIGHEIVGKIVDIDNNNSSLKKGDLISSETHIFDGICYQCQIHNEHVCENMELFGIGRNGGFAQYTTVPIRTAWKNDLSVPLISMSAQEPLGNAVHVVTKAKVFGKRVLIIGLGPTGLCAGMVAKAYGALEVNGINRRSYRRKLAKKIGFDKVSEKLSNSDINKYDVVLEMSGNPTGLQMGLDAVRIAGMIVAFGIPKEEVSINWGKYLINKELTIKSVFGRRIWETWHQTSDLLTTGRINLKKIITHQFDIAEFEKAMKVMKSGECGKIVLKIN